MVMAWRQVWVVREIVENPWSWTAWVKSLCELQCWTVSCYIEKQMSWWGFLPFVLNLSPKIIQPFTVNFWPYFSPWWYDLKKKNPLAVVEYCSHQFWVPKNWKPGLVCVHPQSGQFLYFCIHEMTQRLVPSHLFCLEISPSFPDYTAGSSSLSLFFGFYEWQSVVLVPTNQKTCGNPISLWHFEVDKSFKFDGIHQKN